MFDWLLADQDSRQVRGDLVEIGTYYGKSAILIGHHLQPGEKLTVIDLYETPATDEANRAENAEQYEGVTRAAFEANYLQFHKELPTVIQGFSSEIVDHVASGSIRFGHVDASHHYEHVRDDIQSVQTLLQPEGVIALDDYRSQHTPGTAAAVWEAVLNLGLKPLALTPQKLYGSWGDVDALRCRLVAELGQQSRWLYETQEIRETEFVRLFPKPPSLRQRGLGLMAGVARRLRSLPRR
jgi:hypothetical protein